MTMLIGHALGRARHPSFPPLDGFSNVVHASSDFLKLRSAYAGPCRRIRLASNALHDIGFAGAQIDRADLDSKIAGTSAWGVTRYDQGPAGLNFAQGTAAAQPRVANAGALDLLGGLPADRYGLASGVGYAGTGFTLAQPYTVIITWMATGAPPSAEHTLLGREASGASYIYAVTTSSQVRVNAGALAFPGTWAANAPQIFAFVFNGASSRAVTNGVAGGPFNPGTNALTDTLYLGWSPSNPARVLAGYMSDFIIMSGVVADADIIRIQRALGAPRGIVIP
jgi:hypothetical protein